MQRIPCTDRKINESFKKKMKTKLTEIRQNSLAMLGGHKLENNDN